MEVVKKVFISYAWDTVEDSNKALNLANYLRTKHGINANIDQYEESPAEGWPRWMENQITNSDYVLIIANKAYWDKLYQKSIGKGVTWETGIIYQHLYEAQGNNKRFIPIYFEKGNIQYIPTSIKSATHYDVSDEQQLLKLCNRINGIQNTVKPPLGNRSLTPKERKNIFISTPINMNLWDKANWQGVVFLLDDQKNPNDIIVGLQYSGDEKAAMRIFKEWQDYVNFDKHIDIKFVEGDIEGLQKGYTCLIQPNLNEAALRMKESGIDIDDTLVVTISRFQRMSPTDDFRMFNIFKRLYKKCLPLKIIPIVLKNNALPFSIENCDLLYEFMVRVNNIEFIRAEDIKENSIEACVIPKSIEEIDFFRKGNKL